MSPTGNILSCASMGPSRFADSRHLDALMSELRHRLRHDRNLLAASPLLGSTTNRSGGGRHSKHRERKSRERGKTREEHAWAQAQTASHVIITQKQTVGQWKWRGLAPCALHVTDGLLFFWDIIVLCISRTECVCDFSTVSQPRMRFGSARYVVTQRWRLDRQRRNPETKKKRTHLHREGRWVV